MSRDPYFFTIKFTNLDPFELNLDVIDKFIFFKLEVQFLILRLLYYKKVNEYLLINLSFVESRWPDLIFHHYYLKVDGLIIHHYR